MARWVQTYWKWIVAHVVLRGTYLLWAVLPELAKRHDAQAAKRYEAERDQAIEAALDHGVRKGLAVQEAKQIEARLSTLTFEPHAVLHVSYPSTADKEQVQAIASATSRWLKAGGHGSVPVLAVPDTVGLKKLSVREMRAHGWVRVVKGGK